MRIDDGVDGDSQYIGQVTWMLFLKAFDAKEMEWEFKPDYKGIIPEGYRWRDWADDKEGITGDALIKFINELFDKLKNLDTSDGDMRKFVVKNVFTDINNYMKSGIQLRKLINAINEKVDFNDAREKHTFNDLYEGMLKDLQSSGNAGEYYTPRPVTNFIVEKVDPKLGEIVLDPACGTGGFLTSTIAHFGSIESTEDLQKLQTSINGWEKKPLSFLLAMTNLILHDIEMPNLKHINSLNRPYTDYSEADRVDVVVANPPFGGANGNCLSGGKKRRLFIHKNQITKKDHKFMVFFYAPKQEKEVIAIWNFITRTKRNSSSFTGYRSYCSKTKDFLKYPQTQSFYMHFY